MNKQIFWERQKDLLWLVSTPAGRHLLGIKDKRKIVKITPNASIFFNDYVSEKLISLTGNFNTWDRNASILLPILETLDIYRENRKLENPYEALLHFSGLERNRKYPQIHLAIITPGADSGGRGRIRVTDATFATAHDATTGTLDGAGEIDYTLSGSYTLARYFTPFDTSAIGAGSTITAGGNFERLAGTGKNSVDADTINIVASTQASSTALDAGDYDQSGNTSYASMAISSYNAAGNNDFTLNATGDGQISKTSFTKFAIKTTRDINNTAPTASNYIQFTAASTILSVVYTPAAGGGFLAFL